ncbi:flagellar hook-associated protein FlgL [Aquicella lusitana]|uniref:Flagellar hook-associated protein 3 n=1 Tax=Aquicella lusitana TaxID=254246 RepID=A0A370GDC1_9COXI|nr:flagellar hook-associated protein FlgL [Aquicella lusitana]RDI39963.1 flagellar hook-associated protein 3 [Aquicella lusitana]VVC74566.1 Flagellar hook-associated protein 3 [Aquicella lusitana]
MRIPTFRQFQHQADMISKQFDQMNRLFMQASSGRKIQSSSEDPVLANQIKSNETFIDHMSNYYNNSVLAQNRSKLFQTSIENSVNIVGDIQTLIKKVQSDILSDGDRASIAEQLEGDLKTLLTYANITDGDGNYIFSGFNTNTVPFVQVNGRYQYQGGLNQAMIDIGPNISTLYYESGFKVFGDIFLGNGTFTVNASATNTGTASTSPGSVVDQVNYVADTYTLTLVTNSAGQLAYQVIGAASGQVIPPPPATIPDDAPAYIPDSDITFNGLSFNIGAGANVGDVFTIQPSTQQNVFETVQNLITTLKNPVGNKGNYNQALSQLSASIGQVSTHLTTYLSQAGTRGAAVDSQIKNNDTIINNYKIALSGLADAHMDQVYSALAQKSVALQATQASYIKLQETLMQILRL